MLPFCRDFAGSYEVIVDLQALFEPWESHAKMTTRELRGTLNYGCHASFQPPVGDRSSFS